MKTHTAAPEVRAIRRVTWIGFGVNAVLMVLKILFGIYGHSDALVADGIHSLSDFATDVIVIAFVGIAYKSADSGHPYGHGKFETFATLVIGIFLLFAAFGIAWSGAVAIAESAGGAPVARPGFVALAVAAASIVSKELLYRYTMSAARHTGSPALIATLIGVSAAYFLGDRWRILDPVASVLIAVFIGMSAVRICRPAVDELLDKSLSPAQVRRAEAAISSVEGVKRFHRLRTRRNGRRIIIDAHIKVSPRISVLEGHAIATGVETALRNEFGTDVIANIHVEPHESDNC